MKISVQIPTYNQQDTIARAIESVLSQDYPEIEIVVLDDNSTDDTYTIAKGYESATTKVYRNDCNIGRTKNYKKLLYEKIQGTWVVNLDGDDYFTDPTFLSEGAKKIQSHNLIVFYQATLKAQSLKHSYTFKHKILGSKTEGTIDGREYFKNFHKNDFLGHLSTIYNVQKAREVGFYNHDCLSADAESLLKLALEGNVFLDNKTVGVWSIHNNNESNLFLEKQDDSLKMFERLKNYAIPYIGLKKATAWHMGALKKNSEAYFYSLAKKDFRLFLLKSLTQGRINRHFVILLLKCILRRKL